MYAELVIMFEILRGSRDSPVVQSLNISVPVFHLLLSFI
jgi:hypothetical protein